MYQPMPSGMGERSEKCRYCFESEAGFKNRKPRSSRILCSSFRVDRTFTANAYSHTFNIIRG